MESLTKEVDKTLKRYRKVERRFTPKCPVELWRRSKGGGPVLKLTKWRRDDLMMVDEGDDLGRIGFPMKVRRS